VYLDLPAHLTQPGKFLDPTLLPSSALALFQLKAAYKTTKCINDDQKKNNKFLHLGRRKFVGLSPFKC
jgi:hypothetical protein